MPLAFWLSADVDSPADGLLIADIAIATYCHYAAFWLSLCFLAIAMFATQLH